MNMKIIIGVLLMVISIIGFIIYIFYEQVEPSSGLKWSIYSIVIISFAVGVAFVQVGSGVKPVTRTQKEIRKEIEKIKNEWKKTSVPADLCEIKTNNYSEEIETNEDVRIKMAQALYDPRRNVERVEVTQSVIVCEIILNGKKRKISSPVIPKDETTLKFYLLNAKNIDIYVDDLNQQCYFDLDFLAG